jgi:hypothetical protein
MFLHLLGPKLVVLVSLLNKGDTDHGLDHYSRATIWRVL